MDAVTAAMWAGALAAGIVLGVAGLRWWQGLKTDAEHVLGATPPMPPIPEPMPDPTSAWQALPGGRLELRASGFYIQAHISPSTHPHYALESPENRMLAWSTSLDTLKAIGEKLAAERDEFHRLPAQTIALRAISAAKRTDGAT